MSAFDFKKLPSEVKIASASQDALTKEASSAILNEILAEFSGENKTEKTASAEKKAEEPPKEEAAQEIAEAVTGEDKELTPEEAAAAEAAAEEEQMESTAAAYVVKAELEKQAAAYYDLGSRMAIEKVAEILAEKGAIDANTKNSLSAYTNYLANAMVGTEKSAVGGLMPGSTYDGVYIGQGGAINPAVAGSHAFRNVKGNLAAIEAFNAASAPKDVANQSASLWANRLANLGLKVKGKAQSAIRNIQEHPGIALGGAGLGLAALLGAQAARGRKKSKRRR